MFTLDVMPFAFPLVQMMPDLKTVKRWSSRSIHTDTLDGDDQKPRCASTYVVRPREERERESLRGRRRKMHTSE